MTAASRPRPNAEPEANRTQHSAVHSALTMAHRPHQESVIVDTVIVLGSCPTPSAQNDLLAEVLDVHARLEGPDGRPLARLRSEWRVGIAPAAACYLAPQVLRDPGAAGRPMWWVWPPGSWSDGARREELILGAALALAAAEDVWTDITPGSTPRLTVVDAESTQARPHGIPDEITTAVTTVRDFARSPDGDPAASLRPGALDRICLAAAVLTLPAELRRPGSTGVPQMWPWPDDLWKVGSNDRSVDLVRGVALALAALQTWDRLDDPTRPGLQVLAGGEA